MKENQIEASGGSVPIPDFPERGCVGNQPQQLHIVNEVETGEPAVFCNRAAAGALLPSHSRAPAKSGHHPPLKPIILPSIARLSQGNDLRRSHPQSDLQLPQDGAPGKFQLLLLRREFVLVDLNPGATEPRVLACYR